MSCPHTTHKAILSPMRAAFADFEPRAALAALKDVFAEDAIIHMPHPFGDLEGPEAPF